MNIYNTLKKEYIFIPRHKYYRVIKDTRILKLKIHKS